MKISKSPRLAKIAIGLTLAVPSFAQTDTFSFIPPGGRTLLENVFASGAPAAFITGLLSGPAQQSEAWTKTLKESGGAIPAIATLDDRQLKTLAYYLQHNMPIEVSRQPKDVTAADWSKTLPLDGRDLVLTHCQSCHIITVVITQDRTREAWLGTMNKPSHVEISTTAVQREEIADYLVQNAAIPIDLVPEELRAGGATY
jgi:mono/diheme cytochrome c family protein